MQCDCNKCVWDVSVNHYLIFFSVRIRFFCQQSVIRQNPLHIQRTIFRSPSRSQKATNLSLGWNVTFGFSSKSAYSLNFLSTVSLSEGSTTIRCSLLISPNRSRCWICSADDSITLFFITWNKQGGPKLNKVQNASISSDLNILMLSFRYLLGIKWSFWWWKLWSPDQNNGYAEFSNTRVK